MLMHARVKCVCMLLKKSGLKQHVGKDSKDNKKHHVCRGRRQRKRKKKKVHRMLDNLL